METEFLNLKIVLLLTVGFSLAAVLGYITQRAKLSPLLGYLLAGYLIGPYSPGFVADLEVAEQLAEIGVILMMFSVGLHLKWQDLANVKNIAIPGALGQTAVTTIATMFFIYNAGWSLKSGIILGLALGVSSTVVLLRILLDNKLLNTLQGHIAVGWTIVEDMITVCVLIYVSALAVIPQGENLHVSDIVQSIVFMFVKLVILGILLIFLGRRLISFVLSKILATYSHELFTLSILAITFVIATSSALLFGTSIALGSFLAGMLIGQTEVRKEVTITSRPLKDVFLAIFFLSIGMLFDPKVILEHYFLFFGVLGTILIIKPLVSFFIMLLARYPIKIALPVALALGQIGEFSFVLSEEALRYNLIPDVGYDIIVACSLVSIALNPLLFKWLGYFEDTQET